MKKHLLSTALLLIATATAFSQDSSQQPGAFTENTAATSVNKTLVLTPVIYFDEHPVNHNMHITADSNYYYTINGGSSSSGQINKFDLAGTLLQTYPIMIDGRGLSYNKADGFLYASLYIGDIVRIDDLATGTYTMLFPAAMQNGQASFAISDDGTKFYDFYAGTLRVHDFNTGAVINTITGLLSGSGNYGGDAAVAVDSIYIYTWNAAIKTVYMYDTTGAYLQSFTISDGDNGHSIAFADDKFYVSRDGNYNIGTWYGYDLSVLTGIVSASIENPGFAISPNPFITTIIISFHPENSGENLKQVSLTIKNILGQTVFQKDISSEGKSALGGFRGRVNLEFLPQGIYFLEIIPSTRDDEKRMVKKIVKQ